MNAKLFELRDKATFLPVMAVHMEPTNEADCYLLARSGFGLTPEQQCTYIVLMLLSGGEGPTRCDPCDWGSRTLLTAHKHIIENWATLESGAVIDVQFILGETGEPKLSESVTDPIA